MRKIPLRKAALVVCAAALMQLPLGAAADPLDLGKFVQIVRSRYNTTVRISVKDSSPSEINGINIKTIELQAINDPGRTIRLGVQDGKVSEGDVKVAAYWLRGFPSDTPAAVEELLSYTKPSDSAVVTKVLAAVELVKFPIDKNTNGMFTRSGEQVGVLGASDSVGQTQDAVVDAIAAVAAEGSGDQPSIEAAVTKSSKWIRTVAVGMVDMSISSLEETPSQPDDPNAPPLLSAADPDIPQLRQGLTHDILDRVGSKIVDRLIDNRKGQKIKGVEWGVLVTDIAEAFKAAGVDDVDVRYTGDDKKGTLVIKSGGELIAGDVWAKRGSGDPPTWYLGGEAVQSLLYQIDDKRVAALKSALEQNEVRGEPPPPAEEVEDAVSELEEAMHEGPGTTPEGPGEPVNPNGEGGSGGEKK